MTQTNSEYPTFVASGRTWRVEKDGSYHSSGEGPDFVSIRKDKPEYGSSQWRARMFWSGKEDSLWTTYSTDLHLLFRLANWELTRLEQAAEEARRKAAEAAEAAEKQSSAE